jgi:hypothetical protein
MNTYIFAYTNNEVNQIQKITATGYQNAVDKACTKLEQLNDDLDLIGIDDWEEVIEECNNYAIYVSDLLEIDEI